MEMDGFVSLLGGIDSGRSPNLIQQNQAAFAVNTTFRGGFPTCRPGYSKIEFTFSDGTDSFVDGKFQGAGIYTPTTGTPYFIAQIDGRQYKILISGLSQDITIPGDTNPINRPQIWSVQAENYFIIQDGQSKAWIYNGAVARRSGLHEVPVGTRMAYGLGRLWVAKGREYVGGDIAGGPTGVLAFTENTYLAGGGAFIVPLQSGDITGMTFTANINTATGQGDLVIATENAVFTTVIPPDRTSWQNLTYPIQRIAQIDDGVSGQDAMCLVNGDLWYRSLSGYRSLILGVRNFSQGWGNTPMSTEVTRAIAQDDSNLLKFGSMVNFDNRLLATCSPATSDNGVFHRGLAVLDFDLISSMSNRGQPAWEGIWTGINILKILSGKFNGVSRCFAFVVNCANQIELWEITKDALFDFPTVEPKRIQWFFESRSMEFNDPFGLKKLTSGEVTFDKITGEVDFNIKFRPDEHPFWVNWHNWSMCADYRNCDLDLCEQPPNYAKQYRPKQILPEPPDSCSNVLGVPLRNGFEFQARFELTGSCRMKQFRAIAQIVQESPTAPCPANETCGALTGCEESLFTYSSCETSECAAPTITQQPQGGEITEGQSLVLTVVATGDNPLSYQWYKDGEEVEDSIQDFFNIVNATEDDAGVYTVTVTNACGEVTSEEATVAVSSECVPGEVGEVEPDIFSDAQSSFGTQPAGSYRIEYVEGALQYLGGTVWKLNGSSAHGYRIVHSGGTEVEGPGAGDYGTVMEFASQAAVESHYAGAFVDFTHTGGTISMYLLDDPYGDNAAGTPNPTFRLVRICPI